MRLQSNVKRNINRRQFPGSAEKLAKWAGHTACPANDELSEAAAWFTRPTLLEPRSVKDQMAEAIRKIQKPATAVTRA
jgi:hypothetical protein